MDVKSESTFVEWRKRSGVTATELARALEISKTHLSDLERGTASLTNKLLEKIAAMGIDAEQFRSKHTAWMEERRRAVIERLKVKL